MSTLLAESISSSRLLAPWRALADLVRRDHPDVVILIARKVPRLVELFNLNFGTRCLVVSDIAVPFCHTLIRGRRVAVVDDLVNVGTTLAHARDCVVACGARNVNFYALGKRDGSPVSDNVNCVFPDPLNSEQYEYLAYD